MDHLRIMGFLLLLLFSTILSALQFAAEARVLEHHFHNGVLSQHNSAVTLDSDLDAVAVASAESNPGINSENSTHAANNTMITVEPLQKEATRPGDGSSSKSPTGIKEAATVDGNAESSLHEMLSSHSSTGIGHISNVNVRSDGSILSSGQSPGVGHWEKSKSKHSTSHARTTPNSVLSSGPSPGVGNGHTSAIAGTQSVSGAFNKLPSGPSPGVGHKVTDGYTETAQVSELSKKSSNIIMNILPSGPSPGGGNSATNAATDGRNMMEKMISVESESNKKTVCTQKSESKKKSAIMMNILSSGPSPGVGNSATNGRNMMEKISVVSEPKKKTAVNQESESKKKSASMMNILPSGPSPGVGNSATNGRSTMEKTSKKDEGGMGIIKTFNKLPSGASPGVGHSYTNALLPDKIQRATASEDTKGSDDTPIFQKLPGGPSPGGGHSFVEKSASTVKMELSSNSSRPSRGDDNSSIGKFRPRARGNGMEKKKVERTIGCDDGGLDFYATPTPPMFGTAAAHQS